MKIMRDSCGFYVPSLLLYRIVNCAASAFSCLQSLTVIHKSSFYPADVQLTLWSEPRSSLWGQKQSGSSSSVSTRREQEQQSSVRY